MKTDYQLNNLIFIYSIVFLFFIGTLIYRYVNDAYMNQKYMNLINYDCNGWCILHFINYLLLGFFAPKYWKLIIIIGILFELLEYILQYKFIHIKSKPIKDPIINTIGLFTGIGINKLYYY